MTHIIRQYLGVFAVLILLAFPMRLIALDMPVDAAPKQFGVYLNAQNTGDKILVSKILKQLKRRGATALVFDVKGDYVYFGSDQSELAREAGLIRPLYDLDLIVDAAHEQGIYTIARYIAVKDVNLGSAFPETRLTDPTTGSPLPTEWVKPADETVLEYNRQLIREIAQSHVDEINLDYIRYPTDNLTALNQIRTEEKIVNIEAFVRMARRTIDEVGNGTKLGISTYAILGWDFDLNIKTLGQDVMRFAPFVDIISPMAYPQTFSVAGGYYNPAVHPVSRNYWLVYRTLTGYEELLGEHAWKLRPWIQAYYMTEQGVLDQIAAVYDTGHCGYTVWSQGNHYDAYYSALESADIVIPEKCLRSESVATAE